MTTYKDRFKKKFVKKHSFLDKKVTEEGWKEYCLSLFYAFLLAIFFRAFLYEPFNIPSDSMVPTVLTGDYIYVSKYNYGFSRHSFIFSIPYLPGKLFASAPARGDVVIFKSKKEGDSKHYIKRVIGLPGDHIQMIEGVLHINHKAVKLVKKADYIITSHNQKSRINLFDETLPEGKTHPIIEMNHVSKWDNTAPYIVPQKYYFMMGDNRDNSADSRVLDNLGYVPENNIIGKAGHILSTHECRIWAPWKWVGKNKDKGCERLFKKIE